MKVMSSFVIIFVDLKPFTLRMVLMRTAAGFLFAILNDYTFFGFNEWISYCMIVY